MGTMKAASRNKLPAQKFAFPAQRKEPLSDPAHIRNAAARLNQVKGVSPADKAAAAKRIAGAEKKSGIAGGMGKKK